MVVEAPTPTEVDRAFTGLDAKKKEWAQLPASKKLEMLKEIKYRLQDYVYKAAQAAAYVKGLANDDDAIGMEMLVLGSSVGNYLGCLIRTYSSLARTGIPPPLKPTKLPNGQTSVKLYPLTIGEKLFPLTAGSTAEVVLEPGKTLNQSSPLKQHEDGCIQVVLGAGNQGFLGMKDILTALFEHNSVVLFKPHPQLADFHSIIERALIPLQQAGYYHSLSCNLEMTQHMLHHPLAGHVHMTGGVATHDAIVWGTDEQAAARRAANTPLLKTPITSELGAVTPFILTPGPWSDQQLEMQAQHIAFALGNNVSCNCVAAKVVLLDASWPLAEPFLQRLRAALADMPLPPAYYPGTKQRYDAWRERYPAAECIAAPAQASCRELPGPQHLPWLLHVMEAAPAAAEEEYAFRVEPFAPVLTVVKLHSSGTADFLQQAVQLCNSALWGDLSATLVVDPETEQGHRAAVEEAVAALRYGLIGVNAWVVGSTVMGPVPWGAHSGNTLQDVQSGIGSVGNPYMVEGVQKVVLRVPFCSALATPQPGHKRPLPLGVARVFAALCCRGLLGVLQVLLFGLK